MGNLRFNRWDYLIANHWWGANCGPIALAAVAGLRLGDVRRLVPESEKNGGISEQVMRVALDRAGLRWRASGAALPAYGLAVVRFEGPWERSKAPGHWLAVDGHKVLDTYSIDAWWCRNWCNFEHWRRVGAPLLAWCNIKQAQQAS